MSTEEIKPPRPIQEAKEETGNMPEGAKMIACPRCHNICLVIKLENGDEMMVEGTVMRGVIVAAELIQSVKPPGPDEMIRKLVGRAATGKMSPPIMVPHALLCNPAPLGRGIFPGGQEEAN